MEYQQEYVEQLRSVLQFLQDNGFGKAADAVYEQLNDKEGTEGEDSKDQQRQDSAAGPSEDYEEQYHATATSEPQQYRSRSAEPVLTRCDPPRQRRSVFRPLHGLQACITPSILPDQGLGGC